jgi:signal transduction histidine kinase
VKTTLRLSPRMFRCDQCPGVLDRDLNAARNLARLLEAALSLLNLAVVSAVVLYCLGALTYPVYCFATGGRMLPLFDIHAQSRPTSLGIGEIDTVIVLATPWIVAGVTSLDRVLAAGLLGPTTLAERVRALEQRRSDGIEDTTTRLRRIERDLHDEAQAHLVALAMKLGVARDELADDDAYLAGVRTLLTAAHGNAKQALVELRDLAAQDPATGTGRRARCRAVDARRP